MANARIIYANAADLGTPTASSQASASMAPANLLTDRKSEVWRSTGTTEWFEIAFTADQTIAGVVLPWTNLTATATMRVRLYDVSNAVLLDTGTNLAVPGGSPALWGWTPARLNSNAFGYGGGAYARAWFTSTGAVRKIRVDLVDTSSAQGYIEIGRAVAGPRWDLAKNPDYDLQQSTVDTSKHYRADDGSLGTDPGTTHRKQVIPLSIWANSERDTFWSIVETCGKVRPVLFSLMPDETSDAKGEQKGMIYGKFMDTPATRYPAYRQYSSTMDIEEI